MAEDSVETAQVSLPAVMDSHPAEATDFAGWLENSAARNSLESDRKPVRQRLRFETQGPQLGPAALLREER